MTPELYAVFSLIPFAILVVVFGYLIATLLRSRSRRSR